MSEGKKDLPYEYEIEDAVTIDVAHEPEIAESEPKQPPSSWEPITYGDQLPPQFQ